MDEQKKTLGRSRIYTGNPDNGESGEIPEESRRSRRAQPIGTVPKEHLSEPSGRRRRDEETDAKMRLLWGVLFVLIVVLVVAIIYEVVLGYGSLETGSERMGTNVLETELLSDTEETAAEQQQTEEETEMETEMETVSVTGQDASGSQDSANEQEIDVSQDAQTMDTGEGTALSLDVTLAGLAE
ncbi:MAG: hypothetical protein LUH00_01365 [Lachnospiraceae bacterium]|nr:hypothetical protein [Lachnospiraceae bacterium]